MALLDRVAICEGHDLIVIKATMKAKCTRCGKKKRNCTEVKEGLFCQPCYAKIKSHLLKLDTLPKLQCPKCNGPMSPGEAKVRGNWYTFLSAGVSIQHLWFEPYDGSSKPKIALESYDATDAYFCKTCKIVSVDVKDSKLAKD
jgi:hypothetical protein